MKKLIQMITLLGLTGALVVGCGESDSAGAEVDNTPPSMTTAEQEIFADSVDNRLQIDVSDDYSDINGITLAVSSSDPSLIAEAKISVSKSDKGVELLVSPEADEVGRVLLTIVATDEANNQSLSTLVLDILPNDAFGSELMQQLLDTPADQEPTGINGLTIQDDIGDEPWFESLFET